MYIAKHSFCSVNGRSYQIGEEISWLRYQLLSAIDKKRFVKRSQLVDNWDEFSRNAELEMEGSDAVTTYPTVVGDDWTPDEDIIHFRSEEGIPLGEPIIDVDTEDVPRTEWDNGAGIIQRDDSPVVDSIRDDEPNYDSSYPLNTDNNDTTSSISDSYSGPADSGDSSYTDSGGCDSGGGPTD